MLFHVSEEAGIERFEPRWSEIAGREVVWAIDADHLRNYLLPRDCPRVTYYAGPQTVNADVEKFLGKSKVVVAIESEWFERLRSCRLFCYHFPPDTFKCMDECRLLRQHSACRARMRRGSRRSGYSSNSSAT